MVATNGRHTVLIRSDGSAVACGDDDNGQCSLPELPEGLTYVQVAAGLRHTVLIRSDGSAVACGRNDDGLCSLPVLSEGQTYTPTAAGVRQLILQALYDGSSSSVRLASIGGDELCRLEASPSCPLSELQARLVPMLGWRFRCADIVLPNGEVLWRALSTDRRASLRDFVSR